MKRLVSAAALVVSVCAGQAAADYLRIKVDLKNATPYPATAYLTGFLTRRGYTVAQADLSLLDGFRLEDDEPSIILPEGYQRLLAFLALKGRPIRRPVVGGTLWPVATEDNASSNLRSAPARLQRRARAAVEATGHEIGLVARGHRGSEGHVWLTQRHAPVTVGESEWRYVLHGGMTAADRQTAGPGPRVA